MENDTADDLLYSDDDHYRPESDYIVVAVLLLLGIFPILPALGWIIWSFYRKRWDKKQVSLSFVSLLLADTLQLIASPFLLETVLTGVPCWHASWWCTTVYVLFSVTRFNGLFFHLLVALNKIISLRHPQVVSPQVVSPQVVSAQVVSPVVSLMNFFFEIWSLWLTYTLFAVLAHVFDIRYDIFYGFNIFFGLVALGTAVAACVKALKPFPTLNPTKDNCQSLKVLAVAMFTLVILYVPEFLYWIIYYHKPALTEGFIYVVHYLPCLRTITDSVLCWFVCMDREHPSGQISTQRSLDLALDFSEMEHVVGPPIQEGDVI